MLRLPTVVAAASAAARTGLFRLATTAAANASRTPTWPNSTTMTWSWTSSRQLSLSATLNSSPKRRKHGGRRGAQTKKPELVDVDDDEEDDVVQDNITEDEQLAARGILHKGVGDAADVVDDGLPKDFKRRVLKLNSRRLDTLLNRTSGKSSADVEKMILSGRVRVNEQIVKKKAYNIMKQDEIDVLIEPIADNPALGIALRVKIVDYVLKQHGYDVDVQIWAKLLVENWQHSD